MIRPGSDKKEKEITLRGCALPPSGKYRPHIGFWGRWGEHTVVLLLVPRPGRRRNYISPSRFTQHYILYMGSVHLRKVAISSWQNKLVVCRFVSSNSVIYSDELESCSILTSISFKLEAFGFWLIPRPQIGLEDICQYIYKVKSK